MERQHAQAAAVEPGHQDAGGGWPFSIMDFPDDIRLCILSKFQARELYRFALTCKRAWNDAISSTQLRRILTQEYGLSLRNITADSAAGLLTELTEQERTHLRFSALCTDGGIESLPSDVELHCWADNMFAPNFLEAYCSEVSAPVNVLATFNPELSKPHDDFAAERAAFLLGILELPYRAQVDMGQRDPTLDRDLQTWALRELEMYTMRLYTEQRALLNRGVERRFARREDTLRAHGRIYEIIIAVGRRHQWLNLVQERQLRQVAEQVGHHIPASLPNGTFQHRVYDICRVNKDTRTLVDARVAQPLLSPVLAPRGPRRLVSIEKITVRRRHGFSCPIRTGALLTRVATKPLTSLAGPEAPRHPPLRLVPADVAMATAKGLLRGLAATLSGCTTFPELMAEVEQGALPRVVTRQVVLCDEGKFKGVLIEFDRHQVGCTEVLWPLLWFHFFSKDEAAKLNAWHDDYVTTLGLRWPESSAPPRCMGAEELGEISWVADICREFYRSAGAAGALQQDSAGVLGAAHSAPAPGGADTGVDSSTGSANEGANDGSGSGSSSQPPEPGRARRLFERVVGVFQRAPNDPDDLGAAPEGQQCNVAGAAQEAPVAAVQDEQGLYGWTYSAQKPGELKPVSVVVVDNTKELSVSWTPDGEDEEVEEGTNRRTRLCVQLRQRRVANMVCAQLIHPENLMEMYEDHHPNPNVDVSQIVLEGKHFWLPDDAEVELPLRE